MTPQLDRPTARALVDQIRANLDQIREKIIELWEGQGWRALGYSSWEEMCAAEFRMRLELPRTQRLQVVRGLAREGMSTRAIAGVINVDRSTISRDRQVVQIARPGERPAITGVDGKTYRHSPTVSPLRPSQPNGQPWVIIAVQLGDASRALAICHRQSLPTAISDRDEKLIRGRIEEIRTGLDRLEQAMLLALNHANEEGPQDAV